MHSFSICTVIVFPGVPISRPQIVEMEPHKAKLSWSRVDVPAFGLDDVPLTYMLEVSLKIGLGDEVISRRYSFIFAQTFLFWHKARLSWSRVDVPAFKLDDVPLTYMLEASVKMILG